VTRYDSADFGFLTIGHYNLTPVTNKLEDSIGRPAVLSTPFGVTAPEYLAGILTAYELTGQDGWYDDATNSINAALVDLAAGENLMLLAPYGNTAPMVTSGLGLTVIATDGVLKTAYKRGNTVGDLNRASFEVAVSGQVDQHAKLVAELTARGASGTTAANFLDFDGAAGTVGGRIYLVVTEIEWGTTPCTKLVIALQDGDTPPTFADHTTFTDIVPATTPDGSGTSEMKALAAAAIDRYTCVTWTWTGAHADESVTFAVVVVYD